MNNWPIFDDEVINKVSDVLKSGRVNQWTGNEVKLFEKEFAEYVGTNYCIALSNGTVAIELALYAIGLEYGDEVVVTSRTFIASANAVIVQGGVPVFADVDLNTGNINLDTIKPCISDKTKAIICVHLGGVPCDLEPIMEFAKEKGLWVIEDCAQAHGAKYKDRKVGCIGHIGAWSFCQDKIMTTGGEGGAITLNDEFMFKKAWSYKDHGKDYDLINSPNPTKNLFRWLHTSVGTNMRMTEIQAAIGRVFLKRLDYWVLIRRRNATILDFYFFQLPLVRILDDDDNKYYCAFYKYYIYLNTDRLKIGWDRNRIINEIVDRGFPAFSGSCSEIYLEKAFDNVPLKNRETLPNAQKLGETSIMLLVHPTISQENIHKYASLVRDVLSEASL
jgi:dTDP-4-amino-4,6-dideoxygalactose transaminase